MNVVCLTQILHVAHLDLDDKSKRLFTTKGSSKSQYILSVSCF